MSRKQEGQGEKEKDCGVYHATMQDAMRHAEVNLGFHGRHVEPYWGTTTYNCHLVVGFEAGKRKRWRLDFSDKSEHGKPPKFIHVNEEDFTAPPGHQKTLHRVDSFKNHNGAYLVELQWRKWTSRFNLPEKVKEELAFYAQQRKPG